MGHWDGCMIMSPAVDMEGAYDEDDEDEHPGR